MDYPDDYQGTSRYEDRLDGHLDAILVAIKDLAQGAREDEDEVDFYTRVECTMMDLMFDRLRISGELDASIALETEYDPADRLESMQDLVGINTVLRRYNTQEVVLPRG